jgi:Flp pilus assembly pilin Flp
MVMKLFSELKSFLKDESGAVTVDWVVLTAAVVGLGLIVMNIFAGGIFSATGFFSSELANTMDSAASLY